MRNIYIAGPMTGHQNYNREAFDVAERELSSRGLNVINPHRLVAAVGGASAVVKSPRLLNELIQAELHLVRGSDAVFLLDRWEYSIGTRAEIREAIDAKRMIFTGIEELDEFMSADRKMNGRNHIGGNHD